MDVWIALGLTLLAGMATGIGSILAFAAGRTNYRFLAVSTGFAAGVMLYVSFVEIFVKSAASLVETYGEYWGHWINAASFFGGIFFMGVIDNMIPAAENPHEPRSEEDIARLHRSSPPLPNSDAASASANLPGAGFHQGKLMRTGLFTALAIAVHNFPEGFVTFFMALQDPAVGVAVALAVALHNIPEGVSVSLPIFYATGNRKKAFSYSLMSGLAEPFGAGAAYLIFFLLADGNAVLAPYRWMGILFGVVAGIMVYISLDELLPASRTYGRGHDSILGLAAGMFVMSLSLLIMK
ncbi:MAG: zinc transporter ZupT [Syntrophales bacterium]|nr:zinc transporter ZupT [Syntrophales bacterium]MDD5531777.1 zinc transporter ZupT [Syntrophales bacterium]